MKDLLAMGKLGHQKPEEIRAFIKKIKQTKNTYSSFFLADIINKKM